MEEKCNRLEAKCNSLENELSDMKESQLRQFEYNNMLVKNQSWKYSAPVHSAEYWVENGYDDDVATYLAECSKYLKELTEKLRRGEFPDYPCYHVKNKKGIDLDWDEDDPILDLASSNIMCPHWEEFADALKQFTPVFGVLPDGCETYFSLQYVQLTGGVGRRLKDALMNKPFQTLSFMNRDDVDDNEGMGVDAIMDIVNSNKHLRKITIANKYIDRDDIEKICSAVRYGSIVDLDLRNCFGWNGENGLGDDMITSLLTNGGLAKLERLGYASNGLYSNSSTITTLANFLATNPPLKELDLEHNGLNDNDAFANVLANALRSNTSLRRLNLANNGISHVGKEAFDLVLQNDRSLNLIAGSNHSCTVVLYQFDYFWNVDEKPESFNRARKIYNLLSLRNKSMSTSNVQHFDDIDIKILPFILESIQRNASVVHPFDHLRPGYCRVEPLSIVYEVMRKWDKVFPLYTNRGDNDSIE
jgi:hypothetical protein